MDGLRTTTSRFWRAPRLRAAAPAILDVSLCLVLIAASITATTDTSINDNGTVLDTLLMPAVVLPILVRRRTPLLAACLFALGCVISGLPTFDQIRVMVAVPVALILAYTVASRAERGRALAGLAAILAGLVFVGATDSAVADNGGVVGMVLFSFPLSGLCWGAGRLVWSREGIAARLRERSRQLVEQRERTAALAVELERDRLATDLDVAASVPLREVIAIADSADRSAAQGAAVDREVFARIERLGRRSLNDMRSLLGVLRSDGRGATPEPPPGLAEIDALLAHARAGGRVVDLSVEGDRRPLGAGTELAAYRAVQHALMAVGGDRERPACVRLRYVPGAIEVEVRGLTLDDGGAEVALLAARERVSAYGGRFRCSDGRPPGQRVMRASLPAVAAGA